MFSFKSKKNHTEKLPDFNHEQWGRNRILNFNNITGPGVIDWDEESRTLSLFDNGGFTSGQRDNVTTTFVKACKELHPRRVKIALNDAEMRGFYLFDIVSSCIAMTGVKSFIFPIYPWFSLLEQKKLVDFVNGKNIHLDFQKIEHNDLIVKLKQISTLSLKLHLRDIQTFSLNNFGGVSAMLIDANVISFDLPIVYTMTDDNIASILGCVNEKMEILTLTNLYPRTGVEPIVNFLKNGKCPKKSFGYLTDCIANQEYMGQIIDAVSTLDLDVFEIRYYPQIKPFFDKYIESKMSTFTPKKIKLLCGNDNQEDFVEFEKSINK
jgi:hypothetical protein